jgi:hypothetical protein
MMNYPMTNQHPIVPSPELIQKWCGGSVQQWWKDTNGDIHEFLILATQAAQWGADQEMEACIEWLFLNGYDVTSNRLRAARRPNPPSLKEQALALVEQHEEGWRPSPKDWDTIRRALEALPND